MWTPFRTECELRGALGGSSPVVARLAGRSTPAMAVLMSVGCAGDSADFVRADPALDRYVVSGIPGEASAHLTPTVFRSEREEAVGDLYVMAADGSGMRRLTRGGDFSVPVWAPDGESIAFRQVVGVDAGIGLITAGGGSPVLLTTGEDPLLWLRRIVWSPDGRNILFASNRDEPATDVWQLSRSGGQRHRVLQPAIGNRQSLDVSRAGDARIVYQWAPEAAPDATHGASGVQDLWVADDAQDTDPENVTEGRVYAPSAPRWSPDGSRVAFHGFPLLADGTLDVAALHDVEGGELGAPRAEIYVVDVETHGLRRMTDNDGDDFNPVWTPDGKHLLITSDRDGDGDIWMLPVDAPDRATNLIDDADRPAYDTMPDYFWGAPGVD